MNIERNVSVQTSRFGLQSGPDLPQYGRQLACCRAGLPSPTGFILQVVVTGFCVLLAVIGFGVSQAQFSDSVAMQGVSMMLFLAVAGGLWYAVQQIGLQVKKESLFVYEKGIHLNESVAYIVPGGQWMSFCTGTRSVSLPWRVLKKLQIRETTLDGQPQIEATFRLPDGRTMSFNSGDGHDSILAIEHFSKAIPSR